MRNLAGDTEAPKIVREEMTIAGIEPKKHFLFSDKGEVPADVGGVAYGCYFTRLWYYWEVKCDMPIHLAKEMYYEGGNIGRYDIRVAGHCGCPPPEHWEERGSISTYHIDSQEGLTLFVEYAKAAQKYQAEKSNRFVPYDLVRALEDQKRRKQGNKMVRELKAAAEHLQHAYYRLWEIMNKGYGGTYPWPEGVEPTVDFIANQVFEDCRTLFELAKDEKITSLVTKED